MPKKRTSPFRLLTLALFALITASGCTGDKPNSPFDEELDYKTLEAKNSFSFDEIFNPQTIRVIDNTLFVVESDNPDVSFHVLTIDPDHQSLEYKQGSGRRGEGPGEFMGISDIVETDSLLYFYDGQQLKLTPYDKSTGQLAVRDDIHLRTNGRAVNFFSAGDDRFIGIGLFFGKRFNIMNMDGETVAEHGELIEFNEDFSRRDIALGWFSYGMVQQEEGNTNIYLFSRNADFIEKYDTGGQLLKRVQGEENPEPQMEIRNEWPVHTGSLSYVDVDSDGNHIYGLYSGLPGDEEHHGDMIHKFDRDLNLVDAYRLDNRFTKIAVDGNGNLITYSETDQGLDFHVYELY
ncbi:MAG: BF3164 family lipoprotein [Balneolaceae bacterium]